MSQTKGVNPTLVCRSACEICKEKDLQIIYKLSNVPIHLKCTDEPNLDTSSLTYGKCRICGTIQLTELMPLEILYGTGASHNIQVIGPTWIKYYELFSSILKPFVTDKNILEIGDPSGKLLSKSKNYKGWWIVEPSPCEELLQNSKDNIHVTSKFFDQWISTLLREEMYVTDVIVHSHVFEHLYDPLSFLGQCWDILAEDGIMCFGIPDMQHIVNEGLAPFSGIFFEHTIFMDENIVRSLLERSSFKTESVVYHEHHSLIFTARKSLRTKDKDMKGHICRPETFLLVTAQEHESKFFQVLENYKCFIFKCNDYMRMAKHDKYFVFGASYNTQMLITLGLDTTKIYGILDNSTVKQGKYLQGSHLGIYSPKALESMNNPCVIIRNGYYTHEISVQMRKICRSVHILSHVLC